MRKGILFSVIDLVFVIVFNIIFFTVIGITSVAATWISYGFIHLSYFLVLLTPWLQKRKIDANLFGLTLLSISFVYFLVELVLNSSLIFFGILVYLPVLLVNIVITGIYIISVISTLIVVDKTSQNTTQREQDLKYIKNSCKMLQIVMVSSGNPELNKKVQQAYDIINASPSKSDASVYAIENEIQNSINMLHNAVSIGNNDNANDLVDNIIKLADRRNILIK